MSLLDRLRQMMGAEQAAAVAQAPTAGPARAERLAAMRAEARQRRRKDMRERLAALITPAGTLSGALVKFVNLAPIAEQVGAERWAESFPRIELMSESVIEREVGADTLHIAHGTQGFLLLFTQADMDEEAADDLCDTVFDEIRRLLLGEGAARRPSYDVDPRSLLRMLDENVPFPFVASTRPERTQRLPPDAASSAADPSAATGHAPPAAAPRFDPATDWAEWKAERAADSGFAATPSGERALSAMTVAGSGERAAGAVAVGRSGERSETIADFGRSQERGPAEIAVGRSQEGTVRDPDFGRSQDRPQPDSAWGRSEERPRFAPGSFGASSERPAPRAGAFGGSEERVEGMADWGMSRDRATQEWFFGRTRRREEIESEAHYVPMGRANTMFDAVEISYRRLLETRRSAVTSYLIEPRLDLAGNSHDAAALFAQAARYNANPALDLAILDRAIVDIAPRFEAGARFLYLVPLSFVTAMRRSDRYAYFDRWATVPVSLRKFARFYCYQPSGDLGDTPLGEIATMLRFAAREPVFATAATVGEVRRLANLRARSMMFDAATAAPDKLVQLCRGGRQHQLTFYVAGLGDREGRRAALDAGAAFVAGAPLASAAAIPARPAPVSVAGFLEEG